MSAQSAGRRGERLALRYLRRRGYRLLQRNYRHGRHEIDLVMQDGDCLVFVRSRRARTSPSARRPWPWGARSSGFCAWRPRRTCSATAAPRSPARFDVVEVYLPQEKIQHIVNAFPG